MNTGNTTLLLCLLAAGNIAAAGEAPEPPQAVAGCSACHLKEGIPAQPGWPFLAGMAKADIVERLRGHRARLIPDSTMSKVAAGLSDDEIEQAADYYSRLEPSNPPPVLLKKPAQQPPAQ